MRLAISSRFLVLGLLMLLQFPSPLHAYDQRYAKEFLLAFETLDKGGLYDSSHLRNYILYPYLEYARLKRNVKRVTNQALIDFIRQNKTTWMAEDLNTELLQKLAKQKQWGAVNQHYRPGQSGTKAKCLGLEAKIRTKPTTLDYDKAFELWLSANRRPKLCNPLFSLLRNKGLINDSTTWQRITLAMDKGRTSLAADLAKYTMSPALVKLWIKVRKDPKKHLANKLLMQDNPRAKQVLRYGIKRLARKNRKAAKTKWNKIQKTVSFSRQDKANVDSYIAVRDALDRHPQALSRLARIPHKLKSNDAKLWMARLAVRQGDWRKVRSAIDAMSVEDRQKDRWRYWRAYAGKKLGEKNWQKQLQSIANNASFYGFLSADKLQRPYTRLRQPQRNWQQLTPKIKKLASMQRATELFSIGKPELAKKEWNWTLKRLNKQDKLIAAAYALEIKQPFLAIITVSKTKDWNQVDLRFPLEYRSLVINSAHKHGILPAWVYGIMRRESAFDPKIVSSAKAKGLMQVLPSTAKHVARKLGIKKHRTSDLFIPKKNANIGAAYLSQMLKRFKGNFIKATASYNAGPHRIPRWLPMRRISAERWIESIPFNETRNYVRAVMSYTTIYDHKLHAKNGNSSRLSKRLQAVGPN